MLYVLFAIYNRKKITLNCLECIQKQTYKDYKVVIFNDGSTDGSKEAILKQYPNVVVLNGDGNYWWTRSMNEGLRYILTESNSSDYVLTLNDDTTFGSDYFKILMEAANKSKNLCLGTAYTEDGERLELGIEVDWRKYTYFPVIITKKTLGNIGPVTYEKTDTLPCRGTLIPVELFKKIGLFDEKRLPHYAADYEFFFRAKSAGCKLGVAVNAITKNGDLKANQPSTKKETNLFGHLFSMRSPSNLRNHLILISRYCPTNFKMINYLRVLVGIPLSYLIKGK